MSQVIDLQGARWSSAVRCVARAEYQALDYPRDPEALTFLRDAFDRGINAADNWIQQEQRRQAAEGKTLLTELAVPWGPPGAGWEGHADAIIMPDKIVLEAYHARDCEFREVKALQVAQYARKLGSEYRAVLVALDTTKLDEEAGYPFELHPVDVAGKTGECMRIEAAVVAAYEAGAVNPADKVGDTPEHSECKHCEFRAHCWEGWVPPEPDELPELDDAFSRLIILQSDRAHTKAKLASIDSMLDDVRAELRPYLRPGRTATSNGIQVKRIETAPRVSFRLSDYVKAGHPLTPTMLDYTREAGEPGERWYVSRVSQ